MSPSMALAFHVRLPLPKSCCRWMCEVPAASSIYNRLPSSFHPCSPVFSAFQTTENDGNSGIPRFNKAGNQFLSHPQILNFFRKVVRDSGIVRVAEQNLSDRELTPSARNEIVRDENIVKSIRGKMEKVEDEDVQYVVASLRKEHPSKLPDENTNQNVKFLLALGANERQIVRMFRRNPSLFYCDTFHDIFPNIQVLISFGLTFSEVNKALAVYAGLLKCPSKQVKDTLLYFRDELAINRLGKVIWGCPGILGATIETLRERVECLKEIGIEDVPKAVEQFPALMGLRSEAVRRKAHHLRMIMGRQDVGPLIQSMPQLLGSSMKTVKETFEWLVERFGKETVLQMIDGCPGVMNRRVRNLSQKLDFVCNVMGREIKEVLRTPAVFNYSVSKRLLPRYKALKSVGMENKYGLSYMFSPSDASFKQTFGVYPIYSELDDDSDVLDFQTFIEEKAIPK